jgi:hypothetical protein
MNDDILDLSGYEDDEIGNFLLSGTWLQAASSNVEAWRYEWGAQVLEVEFKDGSVYNYYDVPPGVARAFYNSDSPGRFVWRSLRDQYDYVRLFGPSRERTKPTVVRTRPDVGQAPTTANKPPYNP